YYCWHLVTLMLGAVAAALAAAALGQLSGLWTACLSVFLLAGSVLSIALPDRTVFKGHAARPWPLSFVAQINFAEILSGGGLEEFPSSGRLLFFCDPILSSIGTSIEEQTCASIMFLTEQPDHLGRRDLPVEFSNPGCRCRPRNFIFRPRRVTPSCGCCRHR